MSRALTAQQKKALRQYQDKHPDCMSIDDMDADEWDRIDAMHPCEINWQTANRFLHDRAMEIAHKKG